ncbi:MAG: ABC transporter permease [Anaerolineales bacterium]|nr:MAG: ABC transporter permease [Anaerolineales bacterium]
MGVVGNKIWSDLWANKGRTVQVVLVIAMGTAAIGMIIGISSLVSPTMAARWQATSPAMINLAVDPTMDDNDLMALESVEGVEEVEGQSNTTIEWRVSPEDEWSVGGLIARADYEDQKLNKLILVAGKWPKDRVFALERGHQTAFGIPENGRVTIRVNDREHSVRVGGLIYNQLATPAYFGGTAQFYTTRDRYGELVGDRNFAQVMASAAEYDPEVVTDIADRIQEKLEKQGRESFATGFERVTDPNRHFFQDFLDGLFFLLGVMGLLTLLLGLLLVYNTVNAIISQQVDQIGIMKAIGARTGQILRLYLTNILIYGFLALLVALTLAVVGAWGIANWLVTSFNGDPVGFGVSPWAILAQVLIALLAPLLASLIPISSGARITVREAISTYGLSTGVGLLDRALARVQRISRMVLLTITNTFRNMWRVVLLQVTLVLSGLIFMMVLSVRDSVAYTFGDILFSILNYNVSFALEDAERIGRIEELTLAHPQVKAVEMWGFGTGTLRLAGEPESDDDEAVTMFGVPLPTQLYGYQVRAGRWLNPTDTYAMVLNQNLAADVGVGVGDWITVQQGTRQESTWLVVGLLSDPVILNSGHVPRDVLLRETGSPNKAQTVWIQTVRGGLENEKAIARELRVYYEQNQVEVSPQPGAFGFGGDSALETAQTIINQFNFVIVLLGIMAIIIGAVGSIALSGALSLSVMERRREIGVMRATGASSGVIARLFIGEGLLLGWLSWVIALPLGLPAGRLMLRGLGAAIGFDLVYQYTPAGAISWLGVISILSSLASWFPARGATRISVRESLAYQ